MKINLQHIPEEIIVHLGPPEDECRNINVFLVDYIKNTASREINPLWSENAIIAIIYAVTTCILYKISSGWYRDNGYDFDITASCEDDMFYEENREIYLNISILVDELFDNYISVKGDFPELINCSDSGFETYKMYAVKAAESGMKPDEILKNYFGENIKIVDKSVHDEDIYDSKVFPVKYGDTGETVRIIQENLNFLSHDFPAIPKIMPVDNFFSKGTEIAVRSFQKNFYLKETGIVDKSTWYKLRKYYFDASRLADFINKAKKVLKKEVSDISETEILYCLNVISYFNYHIGLNIVKDLNTEKLSENIKKFQRYYGMNITGESDIATYEKIKSIFMIITENIPERYFCNTARLFSGNILSYGSEKKEVAHLQSYLRVLSEKISEIKFYNVTGVYDTDTLNAVKTYQKLYGLPVNGIVGPVTWNGIAKLYNFFSSNYCNY